MEYYVFFFYLRNNGLFDFSCYRKFSTKNSKFLIANSFESIELFENINSCSNNILIIMFDCKHHPQMEISEEDLITELQNFATMKKVKCFQSCEKQILFIIQFKHPILFFNNLWDHSSQNPRSKFLINYHIESNKHLLHQFKALQLDFNIPAELKTCMT